MIAIVGRRNAGKSSLFNRLVGERRAIVDAAPGVTRDRNVAPARWEEREVWLEDTGGFEAGRAEGLSAGVRRQTLRAMEEADCILYVLDGRAGLSPADEAAVDLLRRSGRPTIFAVNKIDTPKHLSLLADFARLGVDLWPISAAHGLGVEALMSELLHRLPAPQEPAAAEVPAEGGPVRIAIIGRPNVGKSSLLNCLAGDERALVDAAPGTTRDATDTAMEFEGRRYLLIDTAGIRRRSRVEGGVERASVGRALGAVERAQVALLVIDGVEGMTTQDAMLADLTWRWGRGLVLVVTKWDAVSRERRSPRRYLEELRERAPAWADLPTAFVSAHTGHGTRSLLPLAAMVAAQGRRQLRTQELNRRLRQATAAQRPPTYRGRQPRLLYATQTGTEPIEVTVFASHPGHVHPAYARYLDHQLTRAFHLVGTPLQLRFRARR